MSVGTHTVASVFGHAALGHSNKTSPSLTRLSSEKEGVPSSLAGIAKADKASKESTGKKRVGLNIAPGCMFRLVSDR